MASFPRKIRATAVFLLLVGGLSACSPELRHLKKIDPQAGTFTSSLASEYLDYSNSESEQKHRKNSEYFAKKGLAASKGMSVMPDVPPQGQIPRYAFDELQAGRTKLMALLTDTAKAVLPQKAARAQVIYDCWLNQVVLHKGQLHSTDEAITCKEEFRLTLEDLEQSLQKAQLPEQKG